MSIADAAYNTAKKELTKAGSKTAQKSHDKHTGGKGSPVDHGQGLVDGATKEFQAMDKKKDDLTKSNMTQAHLNAINTAKKTLGLR